MVELDFDEEGKKEVKEVVMMVMLKVEVVVMGCCYGYESEDEGDGEKSIKGGGEGGVVVVMELMLELIVKLSPE